MSRDNACAAGGVVRQMSQLSMFPGSCSGSPPAGDRAAWCAPVSQASQRAPALHTAVLTGERRGLSCRPFRRDAGESLRLVGSTESGDCLDFEIFMYNVFASSI